MKSTHIHMPAPSFYSNVCWAFKPWPYESDIQLPTELKKSEPGNHFPTIQIADKNIHSLAWFNNNKKMLYFWNTCNGFLYVPEDYSEAHLMGYIGSSNECYHLFKIDKRHIENGLVYLYDTPYKRVESNT